MMCYGRNGDEFVLNCSLNSVVYVGEGISKMIRLCWKLLGMLSFEGIKIETKWMVSARFSYVKCW